MSVADNIKRIRESKNMSQADLAKAAGYKTRSSITKIESSNSDPSQKSLVRIALALDVKPSDLLSEEKAPSESRKLLNRLVDLVPDSKIDLLTRIVQSVLEDAEKEL